MNAQQGMLLFTALGEGITLLLVYMLIVLKGFRGRVSPCLFLAVMVTLVLIANTHSTQESAVLIQVLVTVVACCIGVGVAILFNHTVHLPPHLVGVQLIFVGIPFAIAVGFGFAAWSTIAGVGVA